MKILSIQDFKTDRGQIQSLTLALIEDEMELVVIEGSDECLVSVKLDEIEHPIGEIIVKLQQSGYKQESARDDFVEWLQTNINKIGGTGGHTRAS